MLEFVADGGETATADFLQESELFADFFNGGVPFEVALFVGDEELGRSVAAPSMGDEFAYQLVGDEANNNGDGEGEHA
jgi:hypothetical protein